MCYQCEVVGAGRGAQVHLHVVVTTCVERVIGRDRRDEKACHVRQEMGGGGRGVHSVVRVIEIDG